MPPIHRDPWDRLIVATALEHDALLVTKDDTIPLYPNIKTVWKELPPQESSNTIIGE